MFLRSAQAESQRASKNVQNNPLSLTDPSGFFSLGSIFKAIGHFFRNIGRIFGHILRAIARSSIGRAIVQIIACATTGPFGCAAASAALTLAAGGSIRDALIGAALAFAQTPWGSGPGDFQGIWGVVGNVVKASETGPIGTIVTHAVVGGAVSMAQGGSFASGAISAAVGALGSEIGGQFGANSIARTAIAAIAGGTASVLTGGKFVNGAVTAAFADMYNRAEHSVSANTCALGGAAMVVVCGAGAAATYFSGGTLAAPAADACFVTGGAAIAACGFAATEDSEEAPRPQAPAPAAEGNPWSPAEVDRRRSKWREVEETGNKDPDSPIPDRGPGQDMGGHGARGGTPHSTGERNVNSGEEHSRRPKGNPIGRPR